MMSSCPGSRTPSALPGSGLSLSSRTRLPWDVASLSFRQATQSFTFMQSSGHKQFAALGVGHPVTSCRAGMSKVPQPCEHQLPAFKLVPDSPLNCIDIWAHWQCCSLLRPGQVMYNTVFVTMAVGSRKVGCAERACEESLRISEPLQQRCRIYGACGAASQHLPLVLSAPYITFPIG